MNHLADKAKQRRSSLNLNSQNELNLKRSSTIEEKNEIDSSVVKKKEIHHSEANVIYVKSITKQVEPQDVDPSSGGKLNQDEDKPIEELEIKKETRHLF